MKSALPKEVVNEVAVRAEEIFCRPAVLYPWDEIIKGVRVDGYPKLQRAVSANTWRSHHRKDPRKQGSSEAYENYFVDNKAAVLRKLGEINTRAELHALETEIVLEIRGKLDNTQNYVLASYNSLRKPVDLFIEHLVAMAKEVDPAMRSRLVPSLYLPIDSQVLDEFPLPGSGSFSLFTDEELGRNGLRHGQSYGHVSTESAYAELSSYVSSRAAEASSATGLKFYPIYFDMLWNGRYRRLGRNLFETNP